MFHECCKKHFIFEKIDGMRKQITLYDDMYNFYKDTKSKRLLVAFVEYLFEWIEPTDLKWIEKTIFNSLKIRMENQWKKSVAWSRSHWWWRPRNTSSELSSKNNRKTTEQTTHKTTEKQEDNNTNVLLLSNILSYDNIYSVYYWKRKWVDEWVCKKQIDRILKQWITLEQIYKCMILYNCECRLKQEWNYVMKLENRLKQFQPLTDEEMDEQLYSIIKSFKDKKKSDDKFWQSTQAKTLWNELKSTFGEEKVKWMLKQANSIQLNFT